MVPPFEISEPLNWDRLEWDEKLNENFSPPSPFSSHQRARMILALAWGPYHQNFSSNHHYWAWALSPSSRKSFPPLRCLVRLHFCHIVGSWMKARKSKDKKPSYSKSSRSRCIYFKKSTEEGWMSCWNVLGRPAALWGFLFQITRLRRFVAVLSEMDLFCFTLWL